MRRGLGAVVALLVLLTACGGGSPNPREADDGADEGFGAVSEGLSRVESGHVELSLRAIKPDTPPRGFEMSGVFAAAETPDDLPLADLTYRNLLPSVTRQSAFVSDGSRAWAVTERGVTELQEERLEALEGGQDPAGLRGLSLDEWFSGPPTEAPGETLDGVETVSYTGAPEGAAVLNDIIAMAGSLGANVPAPLQGAALELVGAALQSPELTVVAGEADNLVRRISFSVGFPPGRNDLRDNLDRLYADRVEFRLDLTQVNRPIAPPAAPQGPAAPTTTAPATTAVPA